MVRFKIDMGITEVIGYDYKPIAPLISVFINSEMVNLR